MNPLDITPPPPWPSIDLPVNSLNPLSSLEDLSQLLDKSGFQVETTPNLSFQTAMNSVTEIGLNSPVPSVGSFVGLSSDETDFSSGDRDAITGVDEKSLPANEWQGEPAKSDGDALIGTPENSLLANDWHGTLAIASGETALARAELDRIAKEAIQRWSHTTFAKASGFDLNEINFTIEDLPGSSIGQTRGTTVAIDPTAAGYGWFVDLTPSDDVEFGSLGNRWLSDASNPAFGRMDLLTVVSHFVGHVLGLDDLETGDRAHELMAGTLLPGERRLSQEPLATDRLPETELGLPHNQLATAIINDTSRANYLTNPTLVPIFKNALKSGFQGLVKTLDEASETLGKELLSIPGLIDNSNLENPIVPGLLGNVKLGSLLQEKIVGAIANIAPNATLTDLASFIDSLNYNTGALNVEFNNVSVNIVPVSSPANPNDYELLLDFTVDANLNDTFKLDLGRKADLYGIKLDSNQSANLGLDTGVKLDLSLGTALTITEGDFDGQADLTDTSIAVDSNDFFVRTADLQATAGVNNNAINLGFDVGFLEVKVENGTFNFNANIAANIVDPNNSDGLNRITLNELKGTASQNLTKLTSNGNMDVVLPVKVKGIPGLPGDFFAVAGATIEIHADGTKLFDGAIAPTGEIDPRSAPPVSVSDGFKNALMPFNNLGSGDIINLLRRVGNELDSLQASDALNLTIPFTENKTLGEVLGWSDGLKSGLIDRLLDAEKNPDFETAQSLAGKLNDILPLDIQGINAKFDPATQELTFHVKLDTALNPVDVPIGFDLNLGELAGFQTDTQVKLTPDCGLEFTFGIDLSGKPKEIALVAIAPESSNGVLAGDATFSLKVGDEAPIPVAIAQTATADNTSLANLFEDIKAALIAAGINDVTLKPSENGKFLLSTTEPLLQVLDVNPIANQALGLQENQTAATLAMVGSDELFLKADAAAPVNGKPGNNVSFALIIDGQTVQVNLLANPTDANLSNTADNQDIDDLIGDLNLALSAAKLADGRSLDSLVLATSINDTIALRTTDPKVQSLQIVDAGSGLDASVLGFTLNKSGDRIGIPTNGVLAANAVFTVTVDDRDLVTVTVAPNAANANAADPVAALIADINAALNSTGLAGEVFAGRIGNRLVLATDSEATQLAIDAVSATAEKLGIQQEFTSKTKTAVDFFVQDAQINGSVNLSADDIEASAHFGFAGIDINGSAKEDGIQDADVTANLNLALKDAATGNTKFSFSDLSAKLDNLIQISTLDWSGNVTLRDIDVASGLPGLDASNLEIPITVSNSSVIGIPQLTPDFSKLENLLDFQKIEFSDLVSALDGVATFLTDNLESFDFLKKDLPLVGVSAADLLTFTEKFKQVVTDFKENPAGSVQELENRLVEALGLPTGSDLVLLNYNSATSSLTIDLTLTEKFSQSLPVDLDLSSFADLPDGLQLQGAAGLEAAGGATAKLSIGIDLSDPANPVPFLNLPNTDISIDFAARSTNLSFVGALGPLGLFVNNGMAAIDGDGNAATNDFVNFGIELIDPTPGDNRIRFDEFSNLNADLELTGALNAALPLFFPTESNYIGKLGFSVPDLATFFSDPTNPANFEAELPDLSELLDNLENFSLLDNLNLAIEGIDSFLAGLQDVLDGEVFGVKLPLIGDKLGDAATFIQDFRTDLYNGLRDTVDNSISKTPALIQESLFDLLGPDGLDLVRDRDNSGTIALNDIQIVGDPAADNFLQWDMTLGSNAQLSKELALDLGLPALGLEIDGGIDLNLGWEFDFGFGLNQEDGFYFVLSDDENNPELEVNLDASLPGLNATGSLGILQLNAKDRADDPTHFNASFDIDLFEEGATDAEDAKKLGLFELGNLGVTPTLSGEADVNLALTAFVGGSQLGSNLTGVLPKIVSDFDLLWTFDTSVFSGNPGTLEELAFNNVGLDLGSFISDFLGPVVEQIQDITKPIEPIIKVLTNPLPVISDLAGEDITLVDLAKIFGYGDFGMIEDIADIIKLVNALPTDAENVIIPFGSLDLLAGNFNLFDADGLDAVRSSGTDLEKVGGFDSAIAQFEQEGGFDGILNSLSGEGAPSTATKSFTNNLNSGNFGAFEFPILTDPSQVFGLLLGRPAVLVTYDMQPLNFEFEYSQFFPIIGPLGAEITGTIGAGIDLAFGFDTYGAQKFAEGDYQYPLDIFRGFYVSDRANADGTGADVPEATLYGSLVGAAVLNLGIAKGGVGGGVFATIDFDLNDPDTDGRVRIEEILNNIYLGAQNASLLSNPVTAVFDISGLVEAHLQWYVKVLNWKKKGQIGPSIPLLNFDLTIPRPPVLASDIGGGELRLNMGDYAGDRLHENTTDGDETFIVTQNGSNITVEAFGEKQTYKNVSKIVAEGGAGNDTILFNNVSIAAEIDGGFGNDIIDLQTSTGNATISGGSGNDRIRGGSGSDRLLGEKGTDFIAGGGGNDAIDGGTEGDILSGDAGLDSISGGEGEDSIGGGANTDFIDGGEGSDRIWGDSSFDENKTQTLTAADRDSLTGGAGNDTIFGEGGNDLIGGGIGSDVVEGNAGEDEIWGDSDFKATGERIAPLPRTRGHDTISGNEGGDRIFGEDGNDFIHGNTGNDTVEGSFGADTIFGDEDKDTLAGQAESDLVFGGAADDSVTGEAGNDLLFGDNGMSAILGDDANSTDDDTFVGIGDKNQLLNFAGDGDALTADLMMTAIDPATDGNDIVDGGAGDDIAFGGAGSDRILGDIVPENIQGETPTGKDVMFGDGGRILLEQRQFKRLKTIDPTFGGNDEIAGNNGDDIAFGGAGNDTIKGGHGTGIATTASDADILLGDNGEIQYLNGEIARINSTNPSDGGNDSLEGNESDDVLVGGTGNDAIAGDEGSDIALGDNGTIVRNDGSEKANDIFSTSPNTGAGDRITGNGGDDLLVGGDGNDAIEGSDGEDIAVGDHANIQRNAQNIVERIETIFEEVGGNDILQGNAGDDNLVGGFASDLISGNEGNDIALGDNGVIVGSDGSAEANDIFTRSPALGSSDTISGDAGNDIIAGGASGDRLSGKEGDDVALGDNARIVRNASTAIELIETIVPDSGGDDFIEGNGGADALLGGFGRDTIEGGNGTDIALGDNGKLDYTLDGNLNTLNLVTTTDPTAGDVDFISGGSENDLLIGGTSGDNIAAGKGNDLVFGDHGKAEGIIDLNALPLNQPNPPFTFTAIDTQIEDKGGDEVIYGEAGDDIILGQQGSDRLFGNEDDDDLIGGHNVAGGSDAADAIDGGTGSDAIAGDNAVITRRADNLSTQMRLLAGETIYDDAGNPQITPDSQPNPTAKSERNIQLLDHSVNANAGTFGSDAIAGGAGNDAIFGELGNDVIQGDSSIAESVSITNPSVERSDDGDDYIEGNGGDDLIFGNSGQDDIIGDSSSLFGNDTPQKRPTGKDTIFGGAGTQIARNNTGDESAEGHARDADAIVGDNGNIFRLVGVSGKYSGKFLNFTYDNYSQSLRIIPRVIQLLDYTPGAKFNNLGGDDLILGETGDDVLYGMTGNDVLFGNAQDDDIFGGTGHDRIYGGTGEDGILGDDGRIFTSRNGETETLYGLKVPEQEANIGLPGPFIGAIVNEEGRLKKEARWMAFESGGNDVIYGGWGDDFLHGGAGDDAISGAEALAEFYSMAPVTDFNPLRYDPTTRKLAAYDAANPRLKINGFLLNFEATNAAGEKIDDGKDCIFGDFGNDWLVGGTRNDRMFGGLGDDMLNADDNHDTNNGLNNRPDDPKFADADFAFGGGGLDVLIANTGGDRVFDWTGEFNSFIVPFSPFGEPTITRSISPHVVNFLLALGEGSGADQHLREPNGELGLVTQKDPQWRDQHGAPRDPQPGNLPGVQRDTQGQPESGSKKQGGNSNKPASSHGAATLFDLTPPGKGQGAQGPNVANSNSGGNAYSQDKGSAAGNSSNIGSSNNGGINKPVPTSGSANSQDKGSAAGNSSNIGSSNNGGSANSQDKGSTAGSASNINNSMKGGSNKPVPTGGNANFQDKGSTAGSASNINNSMKGGSNKPVPTGGSANSHDQGSAAGNSSNIGSSNNSGSANSQDKGSTAGSASNISTAGNNKGSASSPGNSKSSNDMKASALGNNSSVYGNATMAIPSGIAPLHAPVSSPQTKPTGINVSHQVVSTETTASGGDRPTSEPGNSLPNNPSIVNSTVTASSDSAADKPVPADDNVIPKLSDESNFSSGQTGPVLGSFLETTDPQDDEMTPVVGDISPTSESVLNSQPQPDETTPDLADDSNSSASKTPPIAENILSSDSQADKTTQNLGEKANSSVGEISPIAQGVLGSGSQSDGTTPNPSDSNSLVSEISPIAEGVLSSKTSLDEMNSNLGNASNVSESTPSKAIANEPSNNPANVSESTTSKANEPSNNPTPEIPVAENPAKPSESSTIEAKTYTSKDMNQSVPDLGMLLSTLTILDNATILDLNVQLGLTHDRSNDLDVSLKSPDGKSVKLFANVGGGNSNKLANFTLDDDASLPVSAIANPNATIFRPQGDLSAFEGQNLSGTWTLEIRDTKKQKTGSLKGWSMVVTQLG